MSETLHIKELSLQDVFILPAKPNLCQTCATDHVPEFPHNAQSLFYQIKFYQENNHYPTWADAMEHCTNFVKDAWKKSLVGKGIDVNGRHKHEA